MTKDLSPDDLWTSAPPGAELFNPTDLGEVPLAARRYLTHALSPGVRLPRAVHLTMRGEIRLHRWCPFRAEQVIAQDHGFVWAASMRMMGLPIRGSDRLWDGEGRMAWALFGLLPFLRAGGPDVTHSARGRLRAEQVWLPSALAGSKVRWTETDGTHLRASLTLDGEAGDLDLLTDGAGRLRRLSLQRWGNPGHGPFHDESFGGYVEAEGTFDGITIPTRIRAGWYFETDRFEREGEFFRAEVESAAFR